MCVFQVTRHLLKLFDNIADLRFKDSDRDGRGGEEEEKGEVVAVGMYSREAEYVQFSEQCACEGQVVKKNNLVSLQIWVTLYSAIFIDHFTFSNLNSGRVLVGCLREHHALYSSKGDPGGCSHL